MIGKPSRTASPTRRLITSAALLAAALVFAACNTCNFKGQRCQSNAIEECGGTDQQIGRRIQSRPCTGRNPSCVEHDGKAVCATSPQRGCAEGSKRCEGDTLIECVAPWVEVATVCSEVTVAVPGRGVVAGEFRCTTPFGAAECRRP